MDIQNKPKEGYWGNLTPEQEQVFTEFKISVIRMADEVWNYDITQFDNYDFLRFLRARKFDLSKALEMFDRYIKWRIEAEVDNIFTFKFPEIHKVNEIYPHGYHKTDKLGRPVYIERVGMLNVDELYKHTNKERMLKYYVREYEKLRHYVHPACSIMAHKKIETNTTIIDMGGGSSSLFAPKTYNFVKIASGICQDYYPETLEVMFIVNTSWLFQAAWMIVKGFLDAKTKDKIHILGGSYKEKLAEYVDLENLPEFLGGSCKCEPEGCLNKCIGPWKVYLNKFGDDTKEEDLQVPPRPEKWK